MFAFSKLLRCVGKAIAQEGLLELAERIPFGVGWAIKVSVKAYKNYQEENQDENIARVLPVEMERLAQADPAQIEAEARQIAAQVLPDQPAAVREALAGTLALIPAQIRKTFTRKEDLSGKTRPPEFLVRGPEDLVSILPPRPPRFKEGDELPNAPKWVLVRRLDTGGFGEVWLVRQKSLKNSLAAVKFCLDPTAQKRLLKHEARIVDQVMGIKNNNIVRLQDIDLNGEAPWLRYDFIDGGNLLTEGMPDDITSRVDLARERIRILARAVGACHLLDVVHRDLKPANVLIELVDNDGELRKQLKITDFGIGDIIAQQSLDQAKTDTNRSAPFGTPTILRRAYTDMYASQQQKAGSPSTPSDDVYALGVIWFQMIMGDFFLPLGRDYREELRELGLCDELIEVLAKCVADKAERRWPNGKILADRIGRLPANLLTTVENPPVTTAPTDEPPIEQVHPQEWGHVLKPREYYQSVNLLDENFSRTSDPVTNVKIGQILTNGLGMQFAWVPPGKSWLGGGGGKGGERAYFLDSGLWCGIFPVTQAEWREVMGSNPSFFKDNPQYPVETVSFTDAEAFLDKLNTRLAGEGYLFRLPTGDEWEYICRGGPITKEQSKYHFYFARSKNDLSPHPTNDMSSNQANCDGRGPLGTAAKGPFLGHPCDVGTFLPNPLGIYDMHGNIWEWATSRHGKNGQRRERRGGTWSRKPYYCSASRIDTTGIAERAEGLTGFRILAIPFK